MPHGSIRCAAGLAVLLGAAVAATGLSRQDDGCPRAADRVALLDANMRGFSAVRADPQGVCRLLRERLTLEEQSASCVAAPPAGGSRNDFAVPFLRRAVAERCA
jgi:hypothetical protein